MRPGKTTLSRRSILRMAGTGSVGAGLALALAGKHAAGQEAPVATPASYDVHGGHGGQHDMGVVGSFSKAAFDPNAYLRSFNFSELAEPERSRYYRETP